MIADIHNHTYYSGCGKDHPEKLIEAAIKGGIEVFGISDHNYGIDDRKSNYVNQIRQLADKYKDKIKVLCGIEISSYYYQLPPEDWDCHEFDYALVENLQNDDCKITDIPAFAKKFKCRVGIAHTDLFYYCKNRKLYALDFFKSLASANIFWEMNMSYDSIHGWREHTYMLEFFKNEEQQAIVKESGIELSVGFDGHRIEDYDPKRIHYACNKIEELGLKLVNI
ncbi:MAG: PHP domain-containing protein [Clostridia bacterium]|nr:PHP domain-containing protein [Clostridia bacterium]